MATHSIHVLLFLVAAIITRLPQTNADDQLIKVTSEYDESSCICGLNSKILDQLELIVRASTSSCSSSTRPDEVQTIELNPETSSHLRPQEINESSEIKNEVPENNNNIASTTTTPSPPTVKPKEDDNKEAYIEKPNLAEKLPESQVASTTLTTEPSQTKDDKKENGDSGTGGSSSSSSVSTITTFEKLTLEIQKLEQQIKQLKQENESSGSPNNAVQKAENLSTPNEKHEPTAQSATPEEKPNEPVKVVDTGFLNGIMAVDPQNLAKLNQSKRIEPQEMESALQSTVPNVVSNIFSNIQNLSIQTEQLGNEQPILAASENSIVKGNTADEITASGEKIFLSWIEHQIETLHLTASMANYIRKNALNLFKKIVKQYVTRVAKVGDSLEDNMRRATQMALNNTQNLIGFLLKNYINFAGGLMQIIGEQVSRVGKQLDVTGDTIAHTSLNPFDIVSNVMEYLPNPSDYSKYFRAFGKQLLGQLTNQTEESSSPQEAANMAQTNKSQGLISKTMGALSKTLGSWLG